MPNYPSVLYHYTSVDALEAILNSESIRFSSLTHMDDPDEPVSSDMDNIGKYCLVSCWTSDRNESIPQWALYGHSADGRMDGVRIELPVFPFRRYPFVSDSPQEGEVLSYIDICARETDGLGTIVPDSLSLIQIDYTEREELLYPKVKTVLNTSTTNVDGSTEATNSINYSFRHVGEFKRKCWAFQKEWRYKLLVAPWTMDELRNCKSPNDYRVLVGRIDNLSPLPKDEESIDLKIDGDALRKMRVLLGPRISEASANRVHAMLEEHGLSSAERSSLRIK